MPCAFGRSRMVTWPSWLIALSPHSGPRHCGVNIKPMFHGRMYEIFTKYYTNDITKWSGIGQENDFVATILGTGKPIDFSYLLYFN